MDDDFEEKPYQGRAPPVKTTSFLADNKFQTTIAAIVNAVHVGRMAVAELAARHQVLVIAWTLGQFILA